MYQIMIVSKEGSNDINTTYRYLTYIDENGVERIYKCNTINNLKAKVEEMLNGKYAKNDFIIVQPTDYSVVTDL